MRRRGSTRSIGPGTTGEHAEIEVFATGATTTQLRPDSPTADDRDADDPSSLRGPRAPFHARPGHRLGASPGTTSARRGGDSDIVRPMLVPPAVASALATAAGIFVAPLPHLRVRSARDARYLILAVEVVDVGRRPVPATLHLLASPSMFVTVLELLPARQLRWGRHRFVVAGIEAVDELAHRIELAA